MTVARLRQILAGLGAVILAGLAALILLRPEIEVPIPESIVTAQIAERLPQVVEKPGVTVTITGMEADFLAENAVRIQAVADVEGFGLTGRAETDATSGLRYDAGKFYLTDISVDDIRVALDEAAEGKLDDTRSVTGALLGALRSRLEEESEGAGAAFDRILARAEPKLKETLRSVIDGYLGRIPVYSLDGAGTAKEIAALALVDLRFEETQAVAVLDPGLAVQRFLVWALGVVAVLAVLWFVLPLIARTGPSG
ncbi:MAG: hypothetical protein AAFU49_18960 [Pseudomonadota bacterium]